MFPSIDLLVVSVQIDWFVRIWKHRPLDLQSQKYTLTKTVVTKLKNADPTKYTGTTLNHDGLILLASRIQMTLGCFFEKPTLTGLLVSVDVVTVCFHATVPGNLQRYE